MALPPRTIEDKVSDWLRVYSAVKAELEVPGARNIVDLTQATDLTAIQLGVSMARLVSANDRAAAIVAAMLTATGIKPVMLSDPEDPQ